MGSYQIQIVENMLGMHTVKEVDMLAAKEALNIGSHAKDATLENEKGVARKEEESPVSSSPEPDD